MSGALEGIRIIDLSRDMAGSYACMLLGDMGAEVIKVEPVGGDAMRREPEFHLWNRGRRSIVLDFQNQEGRDIFERLVSQSDVLVETFLAKEAHELGLDYDTLSAINPRLIYCAMPPFGESGPLADVPADDGVVAAYSGMYGDQGGGPEFPPIFVHLPFVSYGTAFMASFGISSALFTREMTGEGQKLEVPWFAGYTAMNSAGTVAGPNVTSLARGIPGQQGANPVYRAYKCQDDWIFMATGNVTFWNKLTIALEIEYLLDDERYDNAPWNIPPEHRDFLTELIQEKLSEKPRAYWLERLEEYDIPAAPVATRDEFVQHPQAIYNEMFMEVQDPALGLTRQIGLPVKMHETPRAIGEPAPTLGQHTSDILSELGFSDGQISKLSDNGVVKL